MLIHVNDCFLVPSSLINHAKIAAASDRSCGRKQDESLDLRPIRDNMRCQNESTSDSKQTCYDELAFESALKDARGSFHRWDN